MKIIKAYIHWVLLRRGKKFTDYNMGCGYYITGGWASAFHKQLEVGDEKEMKMNSGKIGIYQLLSYENYRDPHDMTKCSEWSFLGYKDEKSMKDCSFKEYYTKYAK